MILLPRRCSAAASGGSAAAVSLMIRLLILLVSLELGHSFVVHPVTTGVHRHNGNPSPWYQVALADASSSPTEKDWVKRAGGGIPVQPSGDRLLFDPALEGKLAGTTNLNDRISLGFQYLPPVSPRSDSSSTTTIRSDVSLEDVELQDAQHWLEDLGVPLNFAKPTSPVAATVLGRVKLISDDAPGDIEHVVLQLPTGMHYVEGQSLSVIPPGTDSNGKPHKPRLYSIASTRYGDLLDGRTVSLCVRRAVYVDPATGLEDDAKQGVCSNYLCDVHPGDAVKVAGPVGKTMLLPHDPNRDIIMVATGTGIAPFRAFLHRLFMENTVARHMFNGRAWLVLGVPTTGGLLYPEELSVMEDNSEGRLEVTYAISREMKNASGGKRYVQHVLQERADELLQRLDNGAVIYFCGLKGMMPGILDALQQVATERGIDWAQRLSQLKANEQWHVEVY